MSKVIFHCCGGAGINLSDKVLRELEMLGKGFANIEYRYIDTSINNIEKIDHDEAMFYLVKSKQHGVEKISGSGGDRRKNAADITENIKDYMDHFKFLKPTVGEFHAVIFSGSGGSGSVLAPMLIKALMERNFPVFAIMVGDSSSGLINTNTINSIANLNHIAVTMVKKPLNTIYVNNQTFNKGNILKAEQEANKRIFNSLATVLLFLSGVNGELDDQDMINIIDQSQYSTVKIPAGLYGLTTFAGLPEIPDTVIPMIGRTLVNEGVSPDTGITFAAHHKAGIVTEENALSVYDKQFPLHLITCANYFTVEQQMLKKVAADFENIMNSIAINNIDGVGNVDENGLIL